MNNSGERSGHIWTYEQESALRSKMMELKDITVLGEDAGRISTIAFGIRGDVPLHISRARKFLSVLERDLCLSTGQPLPERVNPPVAYISLEIAQDVFGIIDPARDQAIIEQTQTAIENARLVVARLEANNSISPESVKGALNFMRLGTEGYRTVVQRTDKEIDRLMDTKPFPRY